MIKRLEARVAIVIAVVAVFIAVLQKRLIEKYNITSKVSLEVISTYFWFVSLS